MVLRSHVPKKATGSAIHTDQEIDNYMYDRWIVKRAVFLCFCLFLVSTNELNLHA